MGEVFNINGFYNNSSLLCSIENENILQINNFSGQKNIIGVTLKKYNELKEIADKYYNTLIEKGIIEKPKTQEDLMNEMLNQMKIMQEEIISLKQKDNKKEREVITLKKEVKDEK